MANEREPNLPHTLTLKFKVTFKRGPDVIAVVYGVERPYDAFKIGDVTEKVIEAEQYLERLTGLRVHIESGEE